jgi:hypothetical protein
VKPWRLFSLLFSLALVLFATPSAAGRPASLEHRVLAPVRSADSAATVLPASEIRQAFARAAESESATAPQAASRVAVETAPARVENVYPMASEGAALKKMAARLQGKDPIVLSSEQVHVDSLALAKPAKAVPAGQVRVTVDRTRGVILLELADRTEIVKLETSAKIPLDNAALQRGINDVQKGMLRGFRRPDRLQQQPDGSFKVFSDAVAIADPTRADRRILRKRDRIVLRTPALQPKKPVRRARPSARRPAARAPLSRG